MNSRFNISSTDATPAGHRAWFAYGLWLRLVFVGTALAVAGIVLLFDESRSLMDAAAWLFGGTALGLLAWRKTVGTLVRIEEMGVASIGPQPAGSTPGARPAPQAKSPIGLGKAILE